MTHSLDRELTAHTRATRGTLMRSYEFSTREVSVKKKKTSSSPSSSPRSAGLRTIAATKAGAEESNDLRSSQTEPGATQPSPTRPVPQAALSLSPPLSQDDKVSVRIQSSARPTAREMIGSVPRKFFTVAV